MIKTDKACRKCVYSLTNRCHQNISCYECPQCIVEKFQCKCNLIKNGEDCPYFKEWEGE